MGVYKLSRKAEIDLAAMYEFGIYKFGLSQAQKYFYAMHEAFEVLAENVNLGRDASEYIEDRKDSPTRRTPYFICKLQAEFLSLEF